VLQARVRVPWREIARPTEGKGWLRLERADKAPLFIGYDWLDATPREIRAALEALWRARKPV
jgi:hypothetical protein